MRKVQLRGVKGSQKLDGESYTLGEQIQYTDIWANDNYLQFMYERLLMLKELMAPDSTIFLHCNTARGHYLRMLMDEVFGSECFRNEIVWWYWNKFQGNVNRFAANHDSIFSYSRGNPTYKKIKVERPEAVRQLARRWDPKTQSLVNVRNEQGELVYLDSDEKTLDDVWVVPMLQPADQTENVGYPTQKREELLSAIISSSSNEQDLVLDCFIGSGTTAAVAQKLGRRWIGCDINQGAIQTTTKRLAAVMREQAQTALQPQQQSLDAGGQDSDASEASTAPAQLAFSTWRVNDYDLQIQHNEAVELACEYLGITRQRTDSFFDGSRGSRLVKIIPFNHPLTPLDIEAIRDELKARPDESRDIEVVALGCEVAAQAALEAYNRNKPVNQLHLLELRTDQKYAGFMRHEPLHAAIHCERDGEQLIVEVTDVISPTIIKRLNLEEGLFRAQIDDWRAVVDVILIDTAYDGEVFNVQLSDVPQKKTDLVAGRYELPAPPAGSTVAVKVIDMLGEELIVTRSV